MDHGGVQTSAADSKGMQVAPSIFKSLSQVSALTKTGKTTLKKSNVLEQQCNEQHNTCEISE